MLCTSKALNAQSLIGLFLAELVTCLTAIALMLS
jgi:hypothetical protein